MENVYDGVQDVEEPQPRQPGAAEPLPVAASVVPQGCGALRQVHGDAGQGERAHSLQEETAEVTRRYIIDIDNDESKD